MTKKIYTRVFWIVFICFNVFGALFVYSQLLVFRIIFAISGVSLGGWLTYGMANSLKHQVKEIKDLKQELKKTMNK